MDIQLNLFDEASKLMKVQKVKLSALPPNDELLSPEPTRDFVQDIEARGQMEPIHLNKQEDGSLFVVAGRRRIKAFRILAKAKPEKYQTINAFVHSVEPGIAMMAVSAHNNKRSDNALSDLQALEYAYKMKPDASKAEISALTGIPIPRIDRRLKLRKLPSEILEAFVDGKMTTTTAEKVSTMGDDAQKKLKKILKENDKLTTNDTVEVQREQVQDNADTLTLPFIQPVQTITELGWVVVDINEVSILGTIHTTLNDLENALNQYRKDNPDLELRTARVVLD